LIERKFQTASMNPRSGIRIAVLTLLSASGINLLADPLSQAPETQDRSSVSPDKKWEYQPHENEPKLVKAGTDQVAVSFAEECNGCGCGHAITIQAKRKGLARNMLRHIEYTAKVYRWADANTAMVYAVEAEEATAGDLFFGAGFVFTLKFDHSGNCDCREFRRWTGPRSDQGCPAGRATEAQALSLLQARGLTYNVLQPEE
jgi:hypothetical protein